ncbi:MAG: phenylacetate--CoA ligase family protein, partial [Deltaproteobacteria bacterium]|nr:phenylacetate--CoA ligase family protein [Deltaproteobacteria bacterium]
MNSWLVKQFIFPLHERIVGRKTYHYLRELEKLQWASPGDIEDLRFQKLRTLLMHARENIPFYARIFKKVGFEPHKMQAIDDFRVLPLLTKADIRQNLQEMQWKKCPGGLYRYNTGGSSGEPLVFYFDRRRQAYDAAARALTHQWWGIDVGDKELYLWGSPLEITKQDRIKTLRDRLTNQLLLSAFEISPSTISSFVKAFQKFKPKCVFGYPSSISLFCKMARDMNFHLDDIGVQVVFSTAEVLYEDQRQTISSFFGGIPVADG